MWLRDEWCAGVVNDAWEKGRLLGNEWLLLQCLGECRASLTEWNKQSFGHVGKQIIELQRKLQVLENMKGGESTLEDIHAIKKELNRWMFMEEDMWHQRSRNNWLRADDRNTTFFHMKASNQWQRNLINRVLDFNNIWQEDEEQVGRTFLDYFEQLFTSSWLAMEEELLEAIHAKVTDRMNASLLRTFNAQEVEKGLQQMHPLKVPGPDGMPPFFTNISGLRLNLLSLLLH